jgi:glycosyltransferase involved in cell wall biosynthesis
MNQSRPFYRIAQRRLDASALACALDRLLSDASLRSTMGAAGRSWVEKNFRREDLWRELSACYRSLSRFRQDQANSRLYSVNLRIADVQ